MNVKSWLSTNTKQLKDVGIDTARLDCLVLLEDSTGHDRGWLLSHLEHILQGSNLEKLNTKIVQRAGHTPLAYIRGKAEFYGRDFVVNEHTLIPRPETETIIELLRGLATQGQLPAQPHILDIGTGSGCIAITAALELPRAHVSACDIDEKCLKTAQENAQELTATVHFFTSNLIEQTDHATDDKTGMQTYDVLLANLPYVPNDFHINTAASHEPKHAIFGGADGLDLYRTMFQQVDSLETKPSYIIAESLPPSHPELARIAKAAGFRLQKTDDFIQLFTLA